MRSPRNICSIIGGLAGVPLGGIEGINITAGGAPPNVPVTTKIEIFQSPAPPPPPPPPPPPEISGGFHVPSGAISIGGFIAQAMENLNPFPTLRAQPSATEAGGGMQLRPQPFEVPTLDFGFRPQPSGEVTVEIQTLDTSREFRPRQELQTLDQGNIQTGQGGSTREISGVQFGGDYDAAQRSIREGTIPTLTGADPPQLPTLGECTSCSMTEDDRQKLLDQLPADYVEVAFRCPNSDEAEKMARGQPHACIAI